MATPHLFVSDLDGTLLRSDAALSAYALAGLSLLLANGMLFTVASARALPSMQTILRGLPLTLPVIELNGTLLSDFATGEHLKVHSLDADTSEGVLELLTKLGLFPFVATAAHGQVRLNYGALENSAMRWYRDEKLEKADRRLRQVGRLALSLQDATLAFTLLDRHERLVEVVAAVESLYGGRVKQHLFEHPYCVGFSELSIHDAGATKASAITALQQMLGAVGPGSLTVFGDNVNDLDMFRIAGRSVAPKNAVADLLSIATHGYRLDRDSALHLLARVRRKSPLSTSKYGASAMSERVTILDKEGKVLCTTPVITSGTLNHVLLDDEDLTGAQLDGAVMEGVSLYGATLRRASLRKADLYWARLCEADLSHADLSGADLRGANLRDARLHACNLSGADLGSDKVNGGTQLQGADFTDANLQGVRFEGSEYNEKTLFPAGFRPEQHKLKLKP